MFFKESFYCQCQNVIVLRINPQNGLFPADSEVDGYLSYTTGCQLVWFDVRNWDKKSDKNAGPQKNDNEIIFFVIND